MFKQCTMQAFKCRAHVWRLWCHPHSASAPCNTITYNTIPCNTIRYYAIPHSKQYHAIPCNTWILWRHLHAASAPALIWIPPAPNFWASHTIALCNYCNYCTVRLNCQSLIILLFSLELKSASTEHRINLLLSYEVNASQLLAKGLLWSGHVPAIQPPDITHWPQHPGMHHHQYQH